MHVSTLSLNLSAPPRARDVQNSTDEFEHSRSQYAFDSEANMLHVNVSSRRNSGLAPE